ncbi:LPS export ABC transporter permease LptF [Marinospirillum sp.]|uniref:LPS export ABC transporter permease LptF n=1 Tax=Marinospirillum sp. TaxID=2183934 RepID=UPI003A8A273B
MILYRYIGREILLTTAAVTSILLLVIVGSRFARFLGRAASGRISLDALGHLTLLYMPYAAQLILPLSFILALMLTFGRLYMQSEMAVIQASGVSQRQLLKFAFVLALLLAGLTSVGSFYLTPWTQEASARLLEEQRSRTGFESISPGQFTAIGSQAVYIDRLSDDQQLLHQVLLAETRDQQETLVVAQRGFQQLEPETRSRFLVLQEGVRYTLPSTDLSLTQLEFGQYAQRVSQYVPPHIQQQVSMLPFHALLGQDSTEAQVELQWRLALPIMLLVMVFVALPMTKVNPRQGRFMALLPVLLCQMLYLGGLMSLQDMMMKERWPIWPGLWSLHLTFLALGLFLCWRREVLKP